MSAERPAPIAVPRSLRGNVTVLAAFAVLCGVIFLILLRIAGGLNVGDHYRLEAVVPSAVQLVPNSDVRMGGVDVGRVTRISVRGATAVVALELDAERGPVYRDATARVRMKTLVGESYLDLVPGTRDAGAVPEGGLLPIAQARDAVQLDELLSTLAPARRPALRRALSGLGGGLGEQAQNLSRTLGALADAVDVGTPVAEALEAERDGLADLVDHGGRLLGALAERERAIRRLARGGLRAADAVADRDRALAAGLRELPGTLTRTRAATRTLAATGERAVPVLDDLGGAMRALQPAVAELPRTAAVTLHALRRLRAATPRAVALLRALRGVVPPATAALPPLEGLLRELRPLLAGLAPYARDGGQLAALLRSVGSASDATGALARIVPTVTSGVLATLDEDGKRALEALSALGAAQVINTRGVNAYPAAGTALTPGPPTAYRRVERDR